MFVDASSKDIIKLYYKHEFPNGDIDKLDKVLSTYSEAYLATKADEVVRFGIAAILDIIPEEIN